MWQGLDLLDFEDTEIRFPPLILKQRVIIGAEKSRPALPRGSMIQHAAEGRSIDTTGMNCEPNNPAGVLIHDDHYPVTLQSNGFTSEKINAP